MSEHWTCHECGPHVAADEDGCCSGCGSDCASEPCVCRALLVRALRALQSIWLGIPEDADRSYSPDLWIGASGLMACRAVLSDPLAVKLLKEADRANR